MLFVEVTGMGSGVYRMDPGQARKTNLMGGLQLTLLHQPSMYGEDWVYGIQVKDPPKKVSSHSIVSKGLRSNEIISQKNLKVWDIFASQKNQCHCDSANKQD